MKNDSDPADLQLPQLGYYRSIYDLKTTITKSRSGHYTVTIRAGRIVEAREGKISSLGGARCAADRLIKTVGLRLSQSKD